MGKQQTCHFQTLSNNNLKEICTEQNCTLPEESSTVFGTCHLFPAPTSTYWQWPLCRIVVPREQFKIVRISVGMAWPMIGKRSVLVSTKRNILGLWYPKGLHLTRSLQHYKLQLPANNPCCWYWRHIPWFPQQRISHLPQCPQWGSSNPMSGHPFIFFGCIWIDIIHDWVCMIGWR